MNSGDEDLRPAFFWIATKFYGLVVNRGVRQTAAAAIAAAAAGRRQVDPGVAAGRFC